MCLSMNDIDFYVLKFNRLNDNELKYSFIIHCEYQLSKKHNYYSI